jgi:hypothetical protein
MQTLKTTSSSASADREKTRKGSRYRFKSQSVVPERQAPTSHRDNFRAHPAGHKAEKPRLVISRPSVMIIRVSGLFALAGVKATR